MVPVTTNNTLGLPVPTAYKCTGSCPQCGAPLYVDADIPNLAGHLTTLPVIYYTCTCRFNYHTSFVPTYPIPYPVPTPAPVTPFGGNLHHH